MFLKLLELFLILWLDVLTFIFQGLLWANAIIVGFKPPNAIGLIRVSFFSLFPQLYY